MSGRGSPLTITIGKRAFENGPLHIFTPADRIEEHARLLFDHLAKENYLRGLSRETFASRAADTFLAVNQIHPFREGNGRTQRAFFRALARDAGHELHFTVVSRKRMIDASIEGSRGQPEMMRHLFDEISDLVRIAPLREAIQFLDTQKFQWNDRYIATTTPGQSYDGYLVGRNKSNFMMRDNARIFVGNLGDLPASAAIGGPIRFVASGIEREPTKTAT
ncbi:MAG TPA: Fic family protein [Stellaceae bacterium]|nr:Fic family protein [Stellaceae bacterium]